MNGITWLVEQSGRKRLPGTLQRAKPRAEAVHRAIDQTWRTRAEIARIARADPSYVARVLGGLLANGKVERMQARRLMAPQYRRV